MGDTKAVVTPGMQSPWFAARLVDAVQQAVVATDLEGHVLSWNAHACKLFGWTEEEALGRAIVELTPHESSVEEAAAIMERLSCGESWSGEFPVRRKDGSTFIALVVDSPLLDADGALIGVIGVSTNVSEVHGLEAQLRHAQRMEAVGRLAGGIAHDFNNLLTVVLGNLDFVLSTSKLEPEGRVCLADVRGAASRAAELTHQLLAFSRQQLVRPRLLELGAALRALEPLLRRVIGENVIMRFALPDAPTHTLLDPGQFDQVVLNLAFNARDAMPDGGELLLRLEHRAEARAGRSSHTRAVHPGAVILTVSDTGIGIAAEALPHIFEPYFTTKDVGSGTGLGLATAYGIVDLAGGRIEVDSAPGVGTTFRVVLPYVAAASQARSAPPPPALGTSVRSTVLVVEDEDAVRSLIVRVLAREGLAVLTAANGHEALALLTSHRGPIDLLLTDIVMPGLKGFELAEQAPLLRPKIGIVFMTGHIDSEILKRGEHYSHHPMLQKPFSPAELMRVVSEGVVQATR
jgi:PAS domain S-box-containing protein